MPRGKTETITTVPVTNKKRRLFILDVPTRPQEDGDVLVCGSGDMGQLGLGDNDAMQERKRPTQITILEAVVDVVAGGMHSLVLTKDGIVYSFGCNDEGALGRDCSKEGSEFIPDVINLPGKVVKISAGDSHSACLLEDGRVFSWGSFRDSHGNMGLTLEGNKLTPINVLPNEVCCSIASGSDHLVMLTIRGKVFTVGCGEQGQLGRLSLRTASGEGRRGKTELLSPGLVYIRGQLLISEIWATRYCTFMRSTNNTIWAFGLNNYNQLISDKKSQTVISPIPIEVNNVKYIAGGQHHTMVLKYDGSCHVIGRADYGRLGLGKLTKDPSELQQVVGLENKNIIKIAAGEAQSFAITSDGKVYSWGMGSHQLGLGNDDDALVPTLLESKQTLNKRILHMSSGGQHSIFIVSHEENVVESEVPVDVPITTKKKSAVAVKKGKANAIKSPAAVASTMESDIGSTSDLTKIVTNGNHNNDDIEMATVQEAETTTPKEEKKNDQPRRGRKRAMKK